MAIRFAPAGAVEPEVRRFIGSWSGAERALRFGSIGENAACWLVDALAEGRSQGLIALDERGVVGLLDFCCEEAQVEFGVFVAGALRRRGIARALFGELLERVPRAVILADCRTDNLGAVSLLRALRFFVVRRDGIDLRWQREPFSSA